MIRASAAFVSFAVLASGAAAQQPQPPRPVVPGSVSMEDLARQGYEVKSMVQAASRAGRYVVLMQRAGDVRTCLLRIEFAGASLPARQSACF